MNTDHISHVFSVLQYLEKCLGTIRKLISGREDEFSDTMKVLPEQEKILIQMRRVANKLQLETARDDSAGVLRSLRIFYGLNHMVRFDLIRQFTELTQEQVEDHSARPLNCKDVEPKVVLYH